MLWFGTHLVVSLQKIVRMKEKKNTRNDLSEFLERLSDDFQD